MAKKKVLIFGMSSQYGGVESFIINYVRYMDKEKIGFDFLAYNIPPAYAEEIAKMGCKTFVITGRGKNPVKCAKEIKHILKEGNYDVVWSNLCYLSDILILKYAKKYNVPIRIIHSHNSVNMSGRLNGLLHKIHKRSIGKYANHFWSCSDLAGEFFYGDSIRSTENYRVIPNAVDTDKFAFNPDMRVSLRKELKIENQFVVTNVGRLHFQKNQLFLLEIFNEIQKINPNSRLLLIGDGEMRAEIKEKCEKLKISEKVLLLGRRSDISELMSASDVFLMPSLFEGFPVALVEALSSGLPSVTSTAVTKEISKIGDVKYIGLEDEPLKWAQTVLNLPINCRENAHLTVKNAGYDISEQAENMMRFFENSIWK